MGEIVPSRPRAHGSNTSGEEKLGSRQVVEPIVLKRDGRKHTTQEAKPEELGRSLALRAKNIRGKEMSALRNLIKLLA